MINRSRQRKLTGILLAVMMLLSNVMPVFAEVVTGEPVPLVSASPAPEVVATATPVPATPIPETQVPATPVPATPIPVTQVPVTAEPVTAAPASATPEPEASVSPTESAVVTTQTPAPAGPAASEPLVTVEPSAAPSPAASATIAPVVSQEPTAEPVVSAVPTQTPSVTAVPSSEPTAEMTATPAVTEQPVDSQVSLTPQQESLVGVRLSVANFSMMSLLIAESGIPNLYTVRIDYLDEAGVMVTEPYLAIIEAGKSLSIASPVINGYMTTTSVVDVPAISANFSQTVTYTTTPSTYTVNHLQESLDGASYVKVENETLSGVQGNLTDARAKQYAGFVEYPITQQIIAPDNSTVVEVKYWRVTYSINFSTTTEGSAVPFITKKFGAPISSSEIPQNPTRKGYTFLGWDWNNDGLYTSADVAPTAMEAQNRTVNAIWQAGMTEYRIIYWAQNANDNNYTPIATLKTQGLTGTVAAADYLSGTAGTTYYYGNATGAGTAPMTAAEFAELQYFIATSKQTNVVIAADGSTIVNVYYVRRTYNIVYKTDVYLKDWWTAGIYYVYSAGGVYTYPTTNTQNIRYGQDISNIWLSRPTQAMVIAHPQFNGGVVPSYAYGKYYSDGTVFFDYWEHDTLKIRGTTSTLTKEMIDSPTGTTATFKAVWYGATQTWEILETYIDGVRTGSELIYYNQTSMTVQPLPGLTIVKTPLSVMAVSYNGGDPNSGDVWYSDETDYPQYANVGTRLKITWMASYTRNPYQLTLNTNGGIQPNSVTTQKYGLSYASALSFTPTREGYTFMGWFNNANVNFDDPASVSASTPVNTLMPASNLYLYAGWKINDVTLTTTLVKGDTTPLSTYTYQYGDLPDMPPAPTRPGYVFAGWYDASTNAPYVRTAIKTNTVLYATWLVGNQVTYTVNYYLENTTTKLAPSATRLATPEATVTEKPIFIYGYVPLSLSGQSLVITQQGPNTINIYYRKVTNVPYAIRYYDRGHYEAGATGTGLVLSPTITAVNPDNDYSIITRVNDKVITGYNRYNLTDAVYFNGDTTLDKDGVPYRMTFLYDPILYYKPSSDAMGSVTSASETLISTASSSAGSTAIPADGYIFKNWTDASGAIVSTSPTFAPTEVQTGGESGYYQTATFTANFSVDDVKPTLSDILDKTVLEKVPMSPITVTASDNTGFAPTITLTNQPAGVYFDAASQQIKGTPVISDWGLTEESRNFTITVTATDAAGNFVQDTFILTVLRDTDGDLTPDTLDKDDDNDGVPDTSDLQPKVADTTPPAITQPADTAVLEYAVMAKIPVAVTDNNYDATTGTGIYPTVSLSGLPAGLSYNETTREIEGTPRVSDWMDNPDTAYENWRDYTVTITAIDASGNTSTQTFVITVNRDTDKDGIADQSKDGLVNDPDDDNDKIPDAPDSNDKVPDTTAPVISAVTDATYVERIDIPSPGKQVEVMDESGYMPSSVALTGLPEGMSFTYTRNPVQFTNDPQYITGSADSMVWTGAEESRDFPVLVTAKDAAGNTATLTFTITILRDTDLDGIPDTTDTDDDNDGILDTADANPKSFDALAVSLSPETQTVTEFKPITDIAVTENKSATQALAYQNAAGGLSVNEVSNTISGTLTGLVWSNDPAAANYESQQVTLTVSSSVLTGTVLETDTDYATITVLRDTDKDGIPDTTDPDDDGDGIPDALDPEPKVPDNTPPGAPHINTVLSTDTAISGTGEPGAKVTLVFPDGSTATADVDSNGHWTAPVPSGTVLTPGDVITATQTDAAGNKSDPATTVVTTMAELYTPLAGSETVEKGNPGNTYNLTNNIVNLAELPVGTTVTAADGGNVDLNTVGEYTGKVTVTYPDKSFEIVDIPVNVIDTTKPLAPKINPVIALDQSVSGFGEPGAILVVTFPDGTKSEPVTVNPDGTWTAAVPATTRPLADNEVITASQTDASGNLSPNGVTTVLSMAEAYAPSTTPETIERGSIYSLDSLKDNAVLIGLPAGIAVTATAAGDLNTNLVGNYTAYVTLTYPDNSQDVLAVPVSVIDTTKPLPPQINPVYSDSATVSGTGEPGTTVTVVFPDGTGATAPVGANGAWTVPAPANLENYIGQDITATLKDASGNISDPDATPVLSMADRYTPTAAPETVAQGGTYSLTDNITNLGVLPTGTTVTDITPQGAINTAVIGTYEGTVLVTYPDLSTEEVKVPVYVKDLTPPAAPEINQITALDTKVTGTGELGATVTVTFPDGQTATFGPISADGKWAVDVPSNVTLLGGDTVTAIQTDAALNSSLSSDAVVISMADKYNPVSEQETVAYNGTYDLSDNIVNATTLPLDPAHPITQTTGTTIDTLQPGFQVGSVTVTYLDGSVENVPVPVTVLEAAPVDAPVINRIMQNATIITGTGVFGNNILLTLPDGTTHTVSVKEDGTWSFAVPEGTIQLGGQVVFAEQQDPVSLNTSSVVTRTVQSLAMLYPPTTSSEIIERGTGYDFTDNINNLSAMPAGIILLDQVKDVTDMTADNAPNKDVVGTYTTGLIAVPYSDGSVATVGVTLIVEDTIPPAIPLISQITALDTTVSGTGEPGTSVTVTFKDGQTATFGPIGDDGKWTVTVPAGVTLLGGDTVTAVLNDGSNNSPVQTALVRSLADAYTPLAGGETLEMGALTYDLTDNITNAADLPLAVSPAVQFEDLTPAGDINTAVVGDYTGLVKVYYADGSSDVVEVPVAVRDTTAPLAPVISPVTALDTTVTGTGEPGATVTVTFPVKDASGNPTGETLTSTAIVGGNGAWTAGLPSGVTLTTGDILTATQSDGYNTSLPDSETVRSMADAYAPSSTLEVVELYDPDKTFSLLDNITDLPLNAPVDARTDVSSPAINVNQLGNQQGTVRVTYLDGSFDDVPVAVQVIDTRAPGAPVIDTVTALDTIISGTGEVGAVVTVTFPGGQTATSQPIGEDGLWTVAVPAGVTLMEGDKVTAIATDASSNDSLAATATVVTMASQYTPAASREILEFNSDKALAVFTDNITNLLALPANTKVTLQSDADVNTAVVSETQSAQVTVTYPDGSADTVTVPVSVRDTTAPTAPVISPVTALDAAISGTGEPGALVSLVLTVRNADGTTSTYNAGPVPVSDTGEWTLTDLPSGVVLHGGDLVKASQFDGYNTSPSTTVTVSSLAEMYAPTSQNVILEAGAQTSYATGENNLVKPDGFPADAAYQGSVVQTPAIGNYTGTVTVTYRDGSTDVVPVAVSVVDTTMPDIIAQSATLIENKPLSDAAGAANPYVPISTTDAGDMSPTVSVTGLPSGLTYNTLTQRIEGTPSITSWGALEEKRDITVTITASDDSGNQISKDITLTILRDTDMDGDPDLTDPDDDNDKIPDAQDPAPKSPDGMGPVITLPADQSVTENIQIPAVSVTATDDSGIPPTIEVTNLPGGLSFDPDTGLITGTAAVTWTGTEEKKPFTVTVTATDATGNTTTETFVITVLRDSDGDKTPDSLDNDDDGDNIPDLIDLDPKTPDTEKPVLTLNPPGDVVVMEKTPMAKVYVEISDNSMIPPTVSMAGEPNGVTCVQTYDSTTGTVTGTIEGTPLISDWGVNPDGTPEEFRDFTVTITAIDLSGNVLTAEFKITVLRDTDKDGKADMDNPIGGFTGDLDDDGDNIPDAVDPQPKIPDATKPVIDAIPPKVIKETDALLVPVNATDDSGIKPVISIDFAPNGVRYDPISGAITGTPIVIWGLDAYGKEEESRVFPILVKATDINNNEATTPFNLTVLRDTDMDGTPDLYDSDDDNDGIPDLSDPLPKMFTPLVVSINPADQSFTEGAPISAIDITENKTATHTLSYTATQSAQISGLTVSQTANTITGTLTGFTWSNLAGAANYESQVIYLTVDSLGVNATDTASNIAELTVLRDTDKDGIPDTQDPDDDGDGIPDTQDLEPKVKDETLPVITPIADQTAMDKVTTISLTIQASDNSGLPPTVTVSTLPNGLAYDATSGTIAGVPDVTDWGRLEDQRVVTVVVTAEDASGNIATETFTITVMRDTDKDGIPDLTDPDDDGDSIPDGIDLFPKTPDTTAPTINPVSDVTFIEGIRILPIALDPKDDSLVPPTVVVDGLPGGLSYDGKTGEIIGTPALSDWGLTEETRVFPITITVTDLSGNEITETFNITVKRDTDLDGIPDLTDPDDDNDKLPDANDPEPKIPDTTPPEAPVVNPVSDSDKEITGTGEPGATVTVTYPDGSTKTTTVNPDGTWSVPDDKLVGGEVLTVTQTDPSGNVSEETPVTVKDTTAPNPPAINPIKEGDKTITGTGEPGATVKVTYPDGSSQTTIVSEDGTWALNPTYALKAEDVLTATQTDKGGNESAPATIQVGVSPVTAPAPVLPMVYPVLMGAVTISGVAMPEGAIRVKLEDGSVYETTVGLDGAWQIQMKGPLMMGEMIRVTLTTKDGVTLPEIMDACCIH